MSRRAMALALVGAFLLPTLLLAWLGLGALPEETERGAARYRARAEALAGTVAGQLSALLESMDSVAPLAQGLEVRFGSDGSWLGAAFSPAITSGVADPILLTTFTGEIDQLEAKGDRESALARLREIARLCPDAGIVGWALGTLAVLCDATGRSEAGDAARRELLERAPEARDGHGLLRALAAKQVLCERERDPLGARLSLYAEASADYRDLGQTASAEFVRQLRARLALELPAEDARLLRLDREDALRSLERMWRATLRRGVSDWVARGAPGGRSLFEAAPALIPAANPLSMEAPQAFSRPGGRVFLVALQREADAWGGQALSLSSLFERALARLSDDGAPAVAEFTASFESKLVAPPSDSLELVARRELPPPLEAYAIAVRGGDFAAFLAGEHRRALLLASAVVLAILVAAFAAWLSLRAVSREVEAARGREAFVAAVTHELKTPLAAIRLFAEMLERGDVEDAKVREFGGRTVAEADRLARLVDSVLDVARIEHSAAAHTPLEVQTLVAGALGIVERVAEQRGHRLTLSDQSRGAKVRGDFDALTRALVNLLDNALKHSDQPHTVEVEIHARADELVEIAVLDRGRGVPESERLRIFEPFHRLGDELTRDRPGVGLGLALVAKIAAAHGGSAACHARAGGGSRFTLTLPLAT